ncbi:MAG: 4-(cytidine 5'-diphospho)-2-C-methyl-D-erythritol kinase [Defluviitaleaceae bacterium]|nr:4-(cytidine 5'-diphospho)-2-C-methyl-D-erythritol kinase [Defluviitaleaceae bacterium]
MQAFAKINLFLEVLGKRPDGYHNLVSIMQAIDLHDDLIFSFDDENEENICDKGGNIRLVCDNDVVDMPTDDSNLIVKAAKVLVNEFNIRQNLKINLTKRIPMGAGLAGGSSDCAATLRGVNQLLQLNIPNKRLLEIAKTLGADVPFCLTGGTALTEGIGEKITMLPPHPSCYIMLACPKIHISTAEIFSRLAPLLTPLKDSCSGGSKLVSVEGAVNAIHSRDISRIASSFYNVFTPITAGIHPEIQDLISEMISLGAIGASMTGTGSAVFGYFENENIAGAAFKKIQKHIANTFVCKPISRED